MVCVACNVNLHFVWHTVIVTVVTDTKTAVFLSLADLTEDPPPLSADYKAKQQIRKM